VLLQTALAHLAYDARVWLSRAGGVIVIVFGLFLAGVVRIPWLEREHKMHVNPTARRNRYLTSALFGAAFAAGWTPCVGAILGAILTLAVVNAGSAFLLLMAYSLGLGIPFLIVGLFASSAQGFINRHAAAMGVVSKAFGWVLVLMGILVFTQRLERIANFDFVNRLVSPR
jgi:cytochrome c-type biogenesis protein